MKKKELNVNVEINDVYKYIISTPKPDGGLLFIDSNSKILDYDPHWFFNYYKIIDFKYVTSVNSSTIGMVFNAISRLRSDKGFYFCNLYETVERSFDLTGIFDTTNIVVMNSVESCVEAIKKKKKKEESYE